jgi:hypothetical protein
MGGSAYPSSAFPAISPDLYNKVTTDKRAVEIAKKYGLAIPKTMPTAPEPRPFSWQFPQYSQDWAFTPPPPSSYNLPPMTNTGNTRNSSSGGTGSGFGGLAGGGSGGGAGSNKPPNFEDIALAIHRTMRFPLDLVMQAAPHNRWHTDNK